MKTFLQGSITLLDNREEDGGFICVPGFKNYFEKWAKQSPDRQSLLDECKRRKLVIFPTGHKLWKMAIRITSRRGSLIVWDQRTPHGAIPNSSCSFRCAQFVKMFIAPPSAGLSFQSSQRERMRARAAVLRKEFAKCGFDDTELSELGRLVFGLDEEVGGNRENKTMSTQKRKNNSKILP